MPANQPTDEKNLDGYDAPLIPWAKVEARLEQGITQAPGTGGPDRHTSWLATIDPDGRPHVRPLGALWVDGRFIFNSSPAAQKARNLAADPRCSITVATDAFDLIIDGVAKRVTGEALERVATAYHEGGGWPCEVEADALTAPYSAPAAGPPPWWVFEVVATQIYAMGTADPHGATRFRF